MSTLTKKSNLDDAVSRQENAFDEHLKAIREFSAFCLRESQDKPLEQEGTTHDHSSS